MQTRRRRQRRYSRVRLFLGIGVVLVFLILLFKTCHNFHAEQEMEQEMELTEEERNGDEPLYLQTDSRWAELPYGNSSISESGCAPACIAMAAVALTGKKKITPDQVAAYSERMGYYVEGEGSLWKLVEKGSEYLGLHAEELPLSEKRMIDTLDAGGKIICAMGPGDFTTEGHFIEIYRYKEDGFCIHDPNSLKRSRKRWKYNEFSTQIRNLWGIYRK